MSRSWKRESVRALSRPDPLTSLTVIPETLEEDIEHIKNNQTPLASHTTAIDALIAAADSDGITPTPLAVPNGFDRTTDDDQMEISEAACAYEELPVVSSHRPTFGSPIEPAFAPVSEFDFLNPATVSTWVEAW